jgi:putative transcriptional regulator
MIAHHPSTQDLLAFGSGTLTTGDSVAISAHLDYCTGCSKKADQLDAQTAQDWNESVPDANVDMDELSPILDAILSMPPPEIPETLGPAPVSASTAVGGQLFEVPAVLGKLAESGLKWRKLPGGVSLAKVQLDNETLCSFLYMKPGGRVAMHTHEGTETTVVIGGSFRDAAGQYREGDFVQRSEQHTHSSESDEGCLCFTVQDNPVVFTKGLSRLFNPINRRLMRS